MLDEGLETGPGAFLVDEPDQPAAVRQHLEAVRGKIVLSAAETNTPGQVTLHRTDKYRLAHEAGHYGLTMEQYLQMTGRTVAVVRQGPDMSLRTEWIGAPFGGRAGGGDGLSVASNQLLGQGQPAGRRPCAVVQHDRFNRSLIATTLVVAITSNLKLAAMPGNVRLRKGEARLPRSSVVNVSQVVTIDKARLRERIGSLSAQRVRQVLAGLALVLGCDDLDPGE